MPAKNPSNVHRSSAEENLEEVFCYKDKRKLSKNLEISYGGRILQIQAEDTGYALRHAEVTISESMNGVINIFYQGRKLLYKELLVKDHQGHIKNKKEILMAGHPPSGGCCA